MWPDNETEIDFLNFTSVADTVAEVVVRANRRPVSIGVSGPWGVGKSSMIKLIRSSLTRRDSEPAKYLFVEFNAWLYQGYDDVRAALLEVIASALQTEAEKKKSGLQKAKDLFSRVEWLRFAKLSVGTVASTMMGLPAVGLIGEAVRLGMGIASRTADEKTLESAGETVERVANEADGLVKPRHAPSPPQEIHKIRQLFEETLAELDVTLIVLIDDLDRCLPETTITTLEAIRLFLFLKNTAFVIAADDQMIKHAVSRHFEGVDEKHVTSYFDKLIQVPIRVPPLGTQEVRAYLMLLFVESSTLADDVKIRVRTAVCKQLASSWQGKRVDRAFMQTLGVSFGNDLIARFDVADRLAPLMATASHIEGNPRLIKRFLNALSIRMAVAASHGISVDEAVLSKLLLFERCGNPEAYKELARSVNENEQGKPTLLSDWEAAAGSERKLTLPPNWDDDFVREWLTTPPLLASLDMRGALYVSREHAPLITPTDRLSSEGVELLDALLKHPDAAKNLSQRLSVLPRPELTFILDRLLESAQQIQEWGVPPLLEACLVITRCESSQGTRLAAFLQKRPPQQITTPLVPKISGEPWAEKLFATWEDHSEIAGPVKKAIQKVRKNGHV